MTRYVAIKDGVQVTGDNSPRISLTVVWDRLTNAEQDAILAAVSDAASRFRFGMQTGAEVLKTRLRPVVENAFGAERADEILR